MNNKNVISYSAYLALQLLVFQLLLFGVCFCYCYCWCWPGMELVGRLANSNCL